MSRYVLTSAALLMIALTTALGLVRAQPNDDDALRAFLAPPVGCPAPCWQGIRPGATTLDEALTTLETHPWARNIVTSRPINDPNTVFVSWGWTGEQPPYINEARRGRLRAFRGTVQDLQIPSSVALGALWLVLGETAQGTVIASVAAPDREDLHQAVYAEHMLIVRAVTPRDAGASTFWQARVELETTNAGAIAYFGDYRYTLPCRIACARGRDR